MIDYKLLDDSIRFYERFNYTRIETPWAVSQQVDDITKPPDKIPYQLVHNDKRLVASGEQSFLYQYLKGFLPTGQFQTVTPCFRYESFGHFHTKYFMKNELIKTDVVNEDEVKKIVAMAMSFFKNYFPDDVITTVETEDGYDIMCNGLVELGSYGIRKTTFLKWIYGTGCAEPRTSTLINLYGKKVL